MKRHWFYFIPALLFVSLSCGNSSKSQVVDYETEEVATIKAPDFCGDSAFAYTQAQCDFGPRVPNSTAHDQCGDWLVQKFQGFGAVVTEQKDNVKGWDGTTLKMRNIIASYKPETGKRVIVCAHWDSRPWADNDPDTQNHHTPIDGADDGASGVGVLIELARQFQQQMPEIGVD
ncbi:MAG: M28 family peptidase, partial [Bacteroidaceae bacterium]|nr:M28 family peptidase [Bacteroidaceae bacterium]